MNEIRLLEKTTIDQIAAGEVVDRPAAIVKELVENSIDAGASAVSVEIRDGGMSLIRITDNGSGIPKDQIALAFLRHSTSKIRDAADLSFIHTLGFRGEALSSIAAVSKTELCTKTADEVTGTIYEIHGGSEVSCKDAGLPNGTTLIVRDLFYNTPARLKFLKSAQTEAGYITDVMNRICLSHPEVSFKYTVNGAVRLSTPGNGALKDVIYAVFGRSITSSLLEVDDHDDILGITGYIGKPEIVRGNRGFEFFFVNGRYIKDRIIQKALEEAYAGYHMKGTFPFAVIDVHMEPELVDVNVHPSKMEVRFFNSESVFHSIYEILRRRITQKEHIPVFGIGKEEKEKPSPQVKPYIPEPFERAQADLPMQPAVSLPPASEEKHNLSDPQAPEDKQKDPPALPGVAESSAYGVQQELPFIDPQSRPRHRIIGCVFDTYWIVEMDEYMYLIDQHAAHEKVMYERFVAGIRRNEHYAQQIMPSIVLTLSAVEEDVLQQNLEALRKTGFEIEHFGGNEYVLSAVPADLYTVDPKLLFLDMLEDLKELSAKNGPQILTDRIATAACKAAVKGGNKLSFREAQALIDELLTLDNPYHCPHGRPTIIKMSRYELEKKFKRIL